MPIPPDTRAPGDAGHVTDHNNIADELTALVAADAAETSRATTAEGTLASGVAANATAIGTETSRATTAEGTLASGVTANATAIAAETSRATTAEALLAPKASPALTGTPTAPTATALAASTQVATTAYADSAVAAEATRATTAEALKAPLASPALTGNPTAPTQTTGDSSTKLATDAFVATAVAAETTRAEAAEGLGSSGRYYLDAYTGTDDQKFTSALTALLAASPAGGTIVLGPRAHTFASQWATTYTAGVAVPIRIQGAGVAFNGQWGTPSAATTATFTYAGSGAAMTDFQHAGTIEITGIQFKQANTGKPFLLTTNATPMIRDCVFSGGGSGTSCVTDAIVLGGTGTTVGAGDSAPFQGYGGVIERCFFDGIRKHVVWQSFANGIQVLNNTGSTTCGSSDAHGAPYELAPGTGSGAITGNRIEGNTIECVHYKAGVKCVQNAEINVFGPNGFYDATAGFSEYHYFAPGVGNAFNLVIEGYSNETYPLVTDAGNATTYITAQQSVPSSFAQGIKATGATSQFTGGIAPAIVDGSGNQWQEAISGANRLSTYTPSGGGQVTVQTLAYFSAAWWAWYASVTKLWLYNLSGEVDVVAAAGSPVRLGDATSQAGLTVQNGVTTLANPLGITQGGTGQATQAAALTALAGTQSAGKVLRSDGTSTTLANIQAGDVPTLNQSTTGTAAGLSSTLAIASGGTGQTTRQAAIDALTGTQSAGTYARSDGTHTTLSAIQAADIPVLNQNTTGTAKAPDIQYYTTVGTATWTKPAGAVTTEAFVMSGGAGGGSGRRGAAGSVRCGGGGGAGATLMSRKFATADLTSTVTVTVGDGGTGGLAVAANDTSGASGSVSGSSSFGTYLAGQLSTGGLGGTAAAGTGGTGALGGPGTAGAGGSASATGGAGVGINPGALGAAGAPSGGGITSGDVPGAGAAGSYSYLGGSASATFGAAGAVDAASPTTGTSGGVKGTPGGSPGSGAASITTAAQAGGSAYANSGAGGAGGGASLNGNNSGAGGKGGSGFVLVVSYFQ